MVMADSGPRGGHSIVKVEHRVQDKKNKILSCITKMDQFFINCFSCVDIHNIYYMLKIPNKI